MNPFSIDDKTILITGAASGIGRATALLCSEMGAQTVLLDINEEGLKQTVSQMKEGSAVYYALSLTDYDKVVEVIGNFPKLDGVASNAGIVTSLLAKFSDIKEAERIFNVNTLSHIHLVQQLVAQKKLNKGASIVFTSSMSGVYCGLMGGSLYGASKAALVGYSKALAMELAPRGVRVNTIHPGMIVTPLTKGTALSQDVMDEDVKNYPLGRYGKPEEVAAAYVYLLSDATVWMTGSQLLIDGGYSVK